MCHNGNCSCGVKEPLKIDIKYFSKEIDKVKKIGGERSNWFDLRAAERVELKAGQCAKIRLGVGMKLPKGYEAYIVPRSSTFGTWKVMQTNHKAVIDEAYCGDEDEWMLPVYAFEDTVIEVNDRICQFRIQEKMPDVVFNEVEHLEDKSRGGFGTSGKQ